MQLDQGKKVNKKGLLMVTSRTSLTQWGGSRRGDRSLPEKNALIKLRKRVEKKEERAVNYSGSDVWGLSGKMVSGGGSSIFGTYSRY